MKRIIATLLLIFISSLILNNFFAGINFNTNEKVVKTTKEEKDSTLQAPVPLQPGANATEHKKTLI